MNWLDGLIRNFRRLFIWFVTIPPWEQGLRVRLGKHVKQLEPGIHFAIPFIDVVYNQNTRIHIVDAPNQTLTTRDGKVVTLSVAVGFSIEDMLEVYQQVEKPESVISAMVLGEASEYVRGVDAQVCSPARIEEAVRERMEEDLFGLCFHLVQVTDFAFLKAYRIVGEGEGRFHSYFDMEQTHTRR